MQYDFNPRSPRGGATTYNAALKATREIFQSTLPTRGSDSPPIIAKSTIRAFQSTLPTRGSDPFPFSVLPFSIFDFNPRSPRGGATAVRSVIYHRRQFQSTLPTRGSDRGENVKAMQTALFQSTLPTRGSDIFVLCVLAHRAISIHAPHEGERRPE